MQTLKDICFKDPMNSSYITTYISLLTQVKQNYESGNPESE